MAAPRNRGLWANGKPIAPGSRIPVSREALAGQQPSFGGLISQIIASAANQADKNFWLPPGKSPSPITIAMPSQAELNQYGLRQITSEDARRAAKETKRQTQAGERVAGTDEDPRERPTLPVKRERPTLQVKKDY